jgi:hypothetical protein
MNQCPYRIKDANDAGWFRCKLENGHSEDHRAAGPRQVFEGIWHRPGEKSAANSSEEGNITQPPTKHS